MNQTEFETRLRRLVRQASREDLRLQGCVVRSPRPEVSDYDVEITELRKRTAASSDEPVSWDPSE
jgi:hypothetical protein